MSERDSFGAFLVGFIVGGLTGAVVSLLYAPQSGEKTRAVIKEKAIELVDKTTDTLEDTYKKAEVAASDAVEKAQVLIKQAGDQTGKLVEKGQVILEETKEKVKPKKSVA
jgi:gas vesicle protein